MIGELRASGQGKLSLWTSTCIRPPSLNPQAFSHEIKKDLGALDLADEPAVFDFKSDLAAHEQGYLYIQVSGEAVISHVSGVLSRRHRVRHE